MVKILLVDDDPQKTRSVLQTLKSISGCHIEDVDVAHDAQEARAKLRDVQYDLLILDVALPERADTDPSPECGIKLLTELAARTLYRKPREIIGLTAYADVFVQASPSFAKELWHVIQYDAASESWALQLQRKVKYIQLSIENPSMTRHGSDLCVVVALPVPELSSILDLPWSWEDIEIPNEVATFKRGTFNAAGSPRTVIAACAGRVGMTSAAVMADKMIYNFHPRYLAMTGIAAGFRGKCGIGDILIADPTWDYGSGKWEGTKDGPKFRPAPNQLPLHAVVRSRLQAMSQEQEVFDGIRRLWKGQTPDAALRMLIGPVASGSAVIATDDVSSEVLEQHRKTVGLEMEAYGVMAAAHEAPLPEVKAFVLKSVCDFADDAKSDGFQAYAAYTSASALKIFVEKHLPF